MARFASLAVLALLLAPAIARADVVGPAPSDCPEGTRPVTGHCSVCAPDACASDADCGSGQVCRERSYCTRVYETCGGWGGPGASDARPMCGAGVACPADAPCTAARVCVPGSDADGGSGREIVTYGCGCRAVGTGAAEDRAWAVAALATLGLAAALRIRRRA